MRAPGLISPKCPTSQRVPSALCGEKPKQCREERYAVIDGSEAAHALVVETSICCGLYAVDLSKTVVTKCLSRRAEGDLGCYSLPRSRALFLPEICRRGKAPRE